MEIVQNIDKTILFFIQNHIQTTYLNKIMEFITVLGNSGFIWIVISLFLLFSKKYKKIGLLAIVALLLNALLGEVILKNIIARPRPFITYPDLKVFISPPNSFSCPSGHSASSFAAAMTIAYYIKSTRYYLIPLALLIALSRNYLLVHYPSDVFLGIILGIFSSYIVIKFIAPKIKNSRNKFLKELFF